MSAWEYRLSHGAASLIRMKPGRFLEAGQVSRSFWTVSVNRVTFNIFCSLHVEAAEFSMKGSLWGERIGATDKLARGPSGDGYGHPLENDMSSPNKFSVALDASASSESVGLAAPPDSVQARVRPLSPRPVLPFLCPKHLAPLNHLCVYLAICRVLGASDADPTR